VFQTVNPYCVSNSANTAGGALRISATGSTSSCGVTPPPPGRFEAEAATLFHCTVDSNHAGFSGTGFVNYANEVGSYVQWSIPSDTARTATLSIRYANGGTANRPLAVVVNGAAPVTVNFPATGSWTTWANATLSVPLTAGTNTIRATSTTADGGPNVDFLEVS
jgi:hypothetical protein